MMHSLGRLDSYKVRLDAGDPTMNAGNFKDRQQVLGFKYEPQGILRMPELRQHIRPTRQFAHDPMHVLAVHGVINIVLYCCLHLWEQEPLKLGWDKVHGYVQAFLWPSGQGGGSTRPRDTLKPKRVVSHRKAKSFKCQASECISLLPVIAVFAMMIVMPLASTPELQASCLILQRLWEIQDLVLGAARPMQDVEGYAQRIDDAVEVFLELFKATFLVKFMVTKFHAMLHFW